MPMPTKQFMTLLLDHAGMLAANIESPVCFGRTTQTKAE
jgi:hypothetical protein